MLEETAHYLISEAGKKLIAQAETLLAEGSDPVRALVRLRREADLEPAGAAWHLAALRLRGVTKFGAAAHRMYFAEEALEQASSARAAEYHAHRFVSAGITSVADLCGGIGGDALAFARAGLQVALIELDPARALFAAENARVNGFGSNIQVLHGDATKLDFQTDAAWLDPSRRAGGRRVVSPDDYLPPLSLLNDLKTRGIANIGVKLSPAIDHDLAREYGAGLEFLSDGGECKEGLLWTGALRNTDGVGATLLTATGRHALTGMPDDDVFFEPMERGCYLYEPDPAVIRAHLVRTLAAKLDAAPIDPQIAYLTGDRLIETPFARAYEILDWFPYHLKALKKALVQRDVGRVIIKKRGFPEEPEAVRKQLKLTGPNEMIVVLTRIGKQHQAILCRAM